MKHYDVIVIGTGSGNIVTDAALDSGLKVAQIERAKFGGTCLTKGCIPTKIMVTAADFIRESQQAHKIGVNRGDASISWDMLSKRVWHKIDESEAILEEYLKEDNLDVYQGTAYFVADKILRVEYLDGRLSEELTADTIVLAVGARSKKLEIKGLKEVDFITSEDFFGEKWTKEAYNSIAIIGAGAIGCEFAHFFSSIGTKVTVLAKDRILAKADEDISKHLARRYDALGIDVLLNNQLLEVQSFGKQKKLCLKDKFGKEKELVVDEILVAIGVMPNSDLLKLENTNIKTGPGNWVLTNEFLETSVEGIYAIGDINGHGQFRHKANYEADILVHNLFPKALPEGQIDDLKSKEKRFARYDYIPAVTFTYPQVAQIGYTEKEARELAKRNGWEIRCGIQHYSEIAKGYAIGIESGEMEDGFVKVVVDVNSKKILGVHIVGEQASILLQPFASLLASGEITLIPYHTEIASSETKRYREMQYTRYLDPHKITSITESMTAHPSLTELVMWTQYFVPMK